MSTLDDVAAYGAQLAAGIARFADETHQQDPAAARVLLRQVERTAASWLRDNDSPPERVMRGLDTLAEALEPLPPAERLPLWSDVLGFVTTRSRLDYDAATGSA